MFYPDFKDQADLDVSKYKAGNSINKIELNDGLNNQASLKLSQLVQNPDFVYKGCVYSEGIRDYSLKIIPKSTLESSMNALA